MFKTIGERQVLQALVFFSLISIISLWALYLHRNALFVLLVSAFLTFFVFKKILLEKENEKTSKTALALSLLITLLASYPFLVLHPFVDASADPAAHISSLAIKEKMPKDYSPFSPLEYRYQIGFPLLAKTFIDLLPFIDSQTIVWFLGLIFVFVSSLLIYFLCKLFFKSEFAGLLGTSLFVGSKIVFQNMYWGQYAFMMASAFFLATLLAIEKNSKLRYLFFPTIVLAHPGVAFYSIPFFIVRGIIFNNLKETLKILLSGFLVLPSFWITYMHFIKNFGAEEIRAITFETIKETLVAFPLWIGLAIFCFTIMGFAMIIAKKIPKDKFTILFSLTFVFSSLASISLIASGRVLGGRTIELAMFSGLFLSVLTIIKFLEKSQSKAIQSKTIFFITVVSLILFFSSSQLSYLAKGSKITQEESKFALAFKKFDPEYKKTLFLLYNNTKIAELSNKIPFDSLTGWYVSYDKRIAADDPNLESAKKNHELAEKIISEKCIECIKQAEFEYVVVKEDFFSKELQLKKVFEYGEYKVFSKT